MFREVIQGTPFTTDAAHNYFRNISGTSYNGDSSFLSTLRVLLAPRMSENDRIVLRFRSVMPRDGYVADNEERYAVQDMCQPMYLNEVENTLFVVDIFAHTRAEDDACFKAIEHEFMNLYGGFKRLDKVGVFFKRSFVADCYINTQRRVTVLFVEHLDIKRMHYLQMSTLAFLPWYFNQEDGVSEQEMDLLYSLRETTADKYKQCIVALSKQYDFRSDNIRRLLSGFETRFEEKRLEELETEIARFDSQINDLSNRLANSIRERELKTCTIFGLKQKILEQGSQSEIMDYFMCNNHLILETVDDDYMQFEVQDHLTYFDPEGAEALINNPRSLLYQFHGVSNEDMKMLMTALFLDDDPCMKIRFCAAYRLYLSGNVSALSHYGYSGDIVNCMPNPHLDEYACLGNYQMNIHEALRRHDYVGAVEQCIASAKSLNFYDAPVMDEFARKIHNQNRCIEMQDGSILKPAEAIRWLKERDGQSQNKEGDQA